MRKLAPLNEKFDGIKRKNSSRVFAPSAGSLARFLVFAVLIVGRSAEAATSPGAEFVVVDGGTHPRIFYDAKDAPVVSIAAQAFAGDVMLVSGSKVPVSSEAPSGKTAILVGTIGQSALIDGLRRAGKIDTSTVEGHAEAYTVTTVANPVPGVEKALVVAGADRRGTAYGIFSLSREIGVSPWVWWADAQPGKHRRVAVSASTIVQDSPSVRYRGIFINDEDWSLRPWAARTLDRDIGNLGANTYKHVFELLLRLRANTLWPAMHDGSLSFNQIPENAVNADRYAIVMGASHAEPMLRANVAEWDEQIRGQYNFAENRQRVVEYWAERAKANAKYENLWTVGMRGVHDTPMVAGGSDSVKVMEEIFGEQRRMLANETGKAPARIPQLFVPYKEALDIYRKNLQVPEDVTLGWVDDNFGYVRQYSSKAEQRRSGGAGVYYHLSYWGVPYDYLWLDTTPLALIKEEMSKAWETNARNAWIVNVGDIKPAERGAEYFFDLAYDYPGTVALTQTQWITRWAQRTFGAHGAEIAALLDEYYRLGFDRKPEHMGWNWYDLGTQRTQISPVAYGDENARRLADYALLDEKAGAIEKLLPKEKRDAYYEMVLYPIRGAHLMSEKILSADRSFLYAYQGRASANAEATRSAKAWHAVHEETARYNAIGNGKWAHFMNDMPRQLSVFDTPQTARVTPSPTPGLGVAVEGQLEALAAAPAKSNLELGKSLDKWRARPAQKDTLPLFDSATDRAHFVDVFNTGEGKLAFTVTPSASWIKVTSPANSGGDQRLLVSVDWSKLATANASGTIAITGAGSTQTVNVNARRSNALPGTLVEQDGIVAMSAAMFTNNVKVNGKGWTVQPGLGHSTQALSVGATLDSVERPEDAPYVEYRFNTVSAGPVKLHATFLPTFPLNSDHKLRYAVSLNGGAAKIVDVEGNKNWNDAVVRNATTTETAWTIPAGGEQILRVYALDPALVLDSLVVDLGGLRPSYMAPTPTVAK